MPAKQIPTRYLVLVLCVISGLLICYAYWESIKDIYFFCSDWQRIDAFLNSQGMSAPFAFILIQIIQVVIAPIPGQPPGFIGGYFFGTLPGFFLSTIGLTAGSVINFIVGRLLGDHYIRKLIPDRHLDKFDAVLKREGLIIVFIMFVFPGFPKDYLCLFLGLSAIPLKALTLLALVGRMPGTLILSLQGEFYNKEMYGLLILITVLSLVPVYLCFKYRSSVYGWIEKINGKC